MVPSGSEETLSKDTLKKVSLARDRQLAERGALGSVVYPVVYGMIVFQTGFLSRHPGIGEGFFAAFVLLALTRLTLCLGFGRIHPKRPQLWRLGFRGTISLLGLLWGVIAAYSVWAEPWTPTSLFFLFSGSGLAGGLIATTSIDRLAYRLYLVGILVPPATVSFVAEPRYGDVLGGFHVVYFLFLLLQGTRLSSSFELSAANTITMERQRDLLKEAKQVAEEASLAKSRLLANVSHELRTPMNAIIGVTEWALQQNLQEDTESAWEEVHNAGLQLLTVINQVLDFAKIDSGRFSEAKTEPFHLRETVDQVELLFRRAAAERDLVLEFHLSTEPDIIVIGDGGRLRQVLCNLVGNALKFTYRGSIKVFVDWKDSELTARVQDSGTGIDEKYLERLFQPFTQADTSATRRHGGTGLGLAISKDLVESMGGTLTLEGNGPEGCVFLLVIPAPRASQDDLVGATPELSPQHTYSILVIDDDSTNRKVAKRQLDILGHTADLASSGQDGLKLCESKRYDLILMDLQMPDMDGFETTAQLRGSDTSLNSQTPILAFTAHTGANERAKCLSAGMLSFLNKPLQRDVLTKELTALEKQGLLKPPGSDS